MPQPDADLHAAIAEWRTWLAARGFGLVPIANAPKFRWPGYWIAVLSATKGSDERPSC